MGVHPLTFVKQDKAIDERVVRWLCWDAVNISGSAIGSLSPTANVMVDGCGISGFEALCLIWNSCNTAKKEPSVRPSCTVNGGCTNTETGSVGFLERTRMLKSPNNSRIFCISGAGGRPLGPAIRIPMSGMVRYGSMPADSLIHLLKVPSAFSTVRQSW